jgi:hypothetical protein
MTRRIWRIRPGQCRYPSDLSGRRPRVLRWPEAAPTLLVWALPVGVVIGIAGAVVGVAGVIVYFADHDSATTLGSSDVLPSQATPRVPAPTLRKQWENENGVPWPSDPVTGRNQDVAHDIPLADGGTNELDNYGPRPHGEHVDDHKQKGDFKRWGRRGGPKLPGILGGSVGGVVNSRPCN